MIYKIYSSFCTILDMCMDQVQILISLCFLINFWIFWNFMDRQTKS